MTSTTRIILFDPVCGTRRGHNFSTLIKYADWIAAQTALTPELWIAQFDGDLEAQGHAIAAQMPWVFEYFIPTGNHGLFHRLGRATHRLVRRGRPRLVARALAGLLALALFLRSRAAIRGALRRALESRPDLLFLPGADQYSLAALAQLLQARPDLRKVPVHIRLMGVMEHESHLRLTRTAHLGYLKSIASHGLAVSISCETEKYAATISNSLGLPVPVTHIPGSARVATREAGRPRGPGDAFVYCCVGGARADKGYFELAKLATWLRLDAGMPVVVRVQRMGSGNPEFNPDYEIELMRCPNIESLPPVLTDAELHHAIASADAVLLPYSPPTYEQRGSAILFDTLPHGLPIVARRGTAFGDTVDSHGFGFTYEKRKELIAVTRWVAAFGESDLTALGERQRRYLQDMEANLLEALTHEA